jgi:uncharacterized protein (TIGR02453 family)
MTERLDLQPVLSFVKALNRNNNREWFHRHQGEFEDARAHFEVYVGALINELSRTDRLAGVSPSDCIFRLNRDLRFTKDKTPYKPYMSAYVAPGGRKSRQMGYYVHIESGNSILAGGLHDPDAQQLAGWRGSIDRDPRRFKRIAGAQDFRRYFGEVSGDRLKTMPRGYPKDHPEGDLLRLKNVTVVRRVSDAEVVSPAFLRETLATFKAMRPFLRYLDSLG